jgi:hypothetical protein
MIVGDVIDLARDHGIDYDIRFAEDDDLFREITQIERRLIEQLVRVSPWQYPLLGDTLGTISVATWVPNGYLLPVFWRFRSALLFEQDNPFGLPVQLVDGTWAGSIPQVHPSAYLLNNRLVPLDGVTSSVAPVRRFGWAGAHEMVIRTVQEPTPKTARDQVVALLDDALDVMAYALVNFMAKRGRTPDAVVAQIRQDYKEAQQEFFSQAQSYPGNRVYPVG